MAATIRCGEHATRHGMRRVTLVPRNSKRSDAACFRSRTGVNRIIFLYSDLTFLSTWNTVASGYRLAVTARVSFQLRKN